MALMAAETAIWVLLGMARHSVHPVDTSTAVNVYKNCPLALSPQCATKSISTNPGIVSSHSRHIGTGIDFLSSVPGLVVEIPFGDACMTLYRQRSMVEHELLNHNVFISELHSNSSSLSNTDTTSGKS
jgi:hypothetical protein